LCGFYSSKTRYENHPLFNIYMHIDTKNIHIYTYRYMYAMSLGTQSFVGAGPINAMLSASTCNSAKFKRNFIVATIVRAVRPFVCI